MNSFIEVTLKNSTRKMIININSIKYIEPIIWQAENKIVGAIIYINGVTGGFKTEEEYDKVKKMINDAIYSVFTAKCYCEEVKPQKVRII